jgi:oligoendopeptidase F
MTDFHRRRDVTLFNGAANFGEKNAVTVRNLKKFLLQFQAGVHAGMTNARGGTNQDRLQRSVMKRYLRLYLCMVVVVIAGMGPGGAAVGEQAQGDVPERSRIDVKYTWNLGDLYPNQAAWETDFKTCEQGIGAIVGMKGTAAKSPEALLGFLKTSEDLTARVSKLGVYASLLRDQDTRQSGPQGTYDRIVNLGVRLGEATSWFEPEILSLPDGKLLDWCKTNSKLSIYTHHFEDLLRQKAHVLSAREEELLAMAGKVAGTPAETFSMLANADMKFPTIKDEKGNDVQLSEGRYAMYMRSSDRALRERAFKKTLEAYLAFKNTMATTLAGSVQGDIFQARARHYVGALESALSPDNVPISVYDNLISTVHANLPLLHRYMEIRRKKLGIDKVRLYDTFVPLIDGEAPKIGFDDAVATIIRALSPLGKEYLEPMTRAFQSRWIDVYETAGKKSGAYSESTYLSHPYILLNYTNTYDDMSTTAHEMGHSMHSWFSQHSQPYVYGDYPIFLAEVASTSNEIILGDYLRKNAKTDGERLFLVNSALESIRGTVINQTMWAEFEKVIHAQGEQGAPLTYETMSKTYRGLVVKYFGPSFAYDDEVDGYWLRIPHFYRGFYVYKYATSYCASAALAKGVLGGDAKKLEAFLSFLKAGSSDYPIAILKKAGVDMSSPKPIQDTMDLFGQLLDELERLLKVH